MAATFDYSAFIDELRLLVERAKAFGVNERHRESESFRKWRHEAEDLIGRINRLRYDINCGLPERAFRVMAYGSVSGREQQEAFDKDLSDTLNELELVIARFDRYGDPKNRPATQAPTPQTESEQVEKAHCPQCDREQKCLVRGAFHHQWQSDNEEFSVGGHDDYYILQCRGCEFVFFQQQSRFSEDWDVHRDPSTGEETINYPVTVNTFSTLPAKASPTFVRGMNDFVLPLSTIDEQLSHIMNEVYLAHSSESFILASVGLRTAFDRATEILEIDPGHLLGEKLQKLQDKGHVGEAQAKNLAVVVDAGNAAAHRGWAPTAEEFASLLAALEEFLRGAILKTGGSALEVAARIPARPARPRSV